MWRQPASFCLLPLALFFSHSQRTPETCLAFLTRNLVKAEGNWHTYYKFSDKRIKVETGDVLVYSIFLDPAIPEPKGGIDVEFAEGGKPLRDLGVTDQNGIRSHGDGLLQRAIGKWYTRRIPLDVVAGKTIQTWLLTEEGDKPGRYLQFVRDIYIQKTSSREYVYQGGAAPLSEFVSANGYTKSPACVPIEVDRVTEESDFQELVEHVENVARQALALSKLEADLKVVQTYLQSHPDPALKTHYEDAAALVAKLKTKRASEQEIQDTLHSVQHALSHAHPEMEKYTGHLVGHAHIDLQWLWEWQEGLVAAHDTFTQVVKFMDEFQGFTFSQSSSCLYRSIEDTYPELFEKIKAKVKSGQWELVGGRVCEGDTNLVSPESHIRQLLYGQLYFREKFGKVAKVGWEPDTFGHTFQMPQILKLAGIHSYYFCRGGKGKPLFWWQGLDGTKMLAFDEPASGSFYNSGLGYEQFGEMFDFEKATKGAKDSLVVYGVGNHGGGPTREHIETALEWMKDPSKPRVKFSTASEFFSTLRKYDLNKIPTINAELNPVFEGCYVSQSEVKRLNRVAEYSTTSAESVSTIASLFGFRYPRAEFRRNWEDIAWNHHHDTLPGTAIHPTYDKTRTMLERVIADDREISQRALEHLTTRVKPIPGGISVMVFNPCGWTRSGKVQVTLVKSGGDFLDTSKVIVATDSERQTTPVSVSDPIGQVGEFVARDIPAFGWKVFRIAESQQQALLRALPPTMVMDYWDIGSAGTRARLNVLRGVIDLDGTEYGVPELHTETGSGTSAWGIGKIESVQQCKVISREIDHEYAKFTYRIPWDGKKTAESTLTQTFRVERGQIVVDVECDWHALGTYDKNAPLLRLAFSKPSTDSDRATYEIPFGSLQRPIDGKENVALNWADLSDEKGGFGVISDSKSGFRASKANGKTTLSLALVRSSTYPDPAPDQGRHRWRYAIVPHKGDWRTANLPHRAYEFQMPLLSAVVPQDTKGSQPLTWSPLSVDSTDVLVTGIKRAERTDDLILHLFDSGGQGTKAKLHLDKKFQTAAYTNFLEDDLGPATMRTGTLGLDFHRFEIKCLKIEHKTK